MARPNDSFARNPDASGAVLLATHNPGDGKEYPATMAADHEGHIHGSAPAYLLYCGPRVTTTTAVDYFDLFNATGSGKIIRMRGLWPVVDNQAASALARAFTFDVFRTSAVGTGGTAHTYGSATKPAAGAVSIAPLDTANAALPAQITARGLPTGGATASHFLWDMPLYAEETNPASGLAQGINFIPELAHDQPLALREGQGLKVRQNTAVASTGVAFGFLAAFTLP